MKTSVKFFALFLVVAVLAACAGGESESLAKVRIMQGEQVKALQDMTTLLDNNITGIKSKIETITSVDSAMAASMDSVALGTIATDIAGANEIYTRLTGFSSELETLKGDIMGKLIPSAEEMAKGAENPFKGMKDQELLTTFQEYQQRLEGLKTKIYEEI